MLSRPFSISLHTLGAVAGIAWAALWSLTMDMGSEHVFITQTGCERVIGDDTVLFLIVNPLVWPLMALGSLVGDIVTYIFPSMGGGMLSCWYAKEERLVVLLVVSLVNAVALSWIFNRMRHQTLRSALRAFSFKAVFAAKNLSPLRAILLGTIAGYLLSVLLFSFQGMFILAFIPTFWMFPETTTLFSLTMFMAFFLYYRSRRDTLGVPPLTHIITLLLVSSLSMLGLLIVAWIGYVSIAGDSIVDALAFLPLVFLQPFVLIFWLSLTGCLAIWLYYRPRRSARVS